MQRLAEYDMDVGGLATRALELKGQGPGLVLLHAFAAPHATRDGLARLLASGRKLLPELDPPPFDFAAIACPVLLVWGTRDHMCPHRGARVLTEALPAARVELIEGCGHCPQLEAPERLLELLAGFPEPALAAA